MKKFIIVSLVIGVVGGSLLAYGVISLLKLMGANMFLPSTVIQIYLLSIGSIIALTAAVKLKLKYSSKNRS